MKQKDNIYIYIYIYIYSKRLREEGLIQQADIEYIQQADIEYIIYLYKQLPI